MKAKGLYQFGVIGAGMIAEAHAQNLQRSSRAAARWMAATTADKAARVGGRYAIPNTTAQYQDMLRDKAVDAVIICTPPHLHAEMMLEALQAGKHVLVEKPLALTLAEADRMIAAHRQHPHLLAMECAARHARLHPKYRVVKEYIQRGALGEVYYLHHNAVSQQARPGIEYHPAAKWFLDQKQAGGGPLFDWGVYDLSFHLGVLGDQHELERVNTVMLARDLDRKEVGAPVYDVEEHFAASISFSGGLRFYWERAAHANMGARNETRIYGTRGGIKLAFCSWDAPELTFYGLDETETAFHRTEQLDYQNQDDGYALIEHFLDCLEGREKPIQALPVARRHLQIIQDCYQTYLKTKR